jgi:hypothetical protein
MFPKLDWYRYVFVVYSNSQLKHSSCWFLAQNASVQNTDGSVSCLEPADVLDWMGEWKHIRSAGTLAKR